MAIWAWRLHRSYVHPSEVARLLRLLQRADPYGLQTGATGPAKRALSNDDNYNGDDDDDYHSQLAAAAEVDATVAAERQAEALSRVREGLARPRTRPPPVLFPAKAESVRPTSAAAAAAAVAAAAAAVAAAAVHPPRRVGVTADGDVVELELLLRPKASRMMEHTRAAGAGGGGGDGGDAGVPKQWVDCGRGTVQVVRVRRPRQSARPLRPPPRPLAVPSSLPCETSPTRTGTGADTGAGINASPSSNNANAASPGGPASSFVRLEFVARASGARWRFRVAESARAEAHPDGDSACIVCYNLELVPSDDDAATVSATKNHATGFESSPLSTPTSTSTPTPTSLQPAGQASSIVDTIVDGGGDGSGLPVSSSLYAHIALRLRNKATARRLMALCTAAGIAASPTRPAWEIIAEV